jgi:hypothetical protein
MLALKAQDVQLAHEQLSETLAAKLSSEERASLTYAIQQYIAAQEAKSSGYNHAADRLEVAGKRSAIILGVLPVLTLLKAIALGVKGKIDDSSAIIAVGVLWLLEGAASMIITPSLFGAAVGKRAHARQAEDQIRTLAHMLVRLHTAQAATVQ